MKFVYAQLDIKEIERRVRAEQCRTKKRVTEVVLNGAEWCEFVQAMRGALRPYERAFRFYLSEPLPPVACFTGECASCDREQVVHVITVRPE